MQSNSTIVPVPAKSDINSGLTSPPSGFMVNMLGTPGSLSENCSEVTNDHLRSRIVTELVGPLRVTGLSTAILSISHVFQDVIAAGKGDLLVGLNTAGMLCCRKKRGGSSFSNHSWGTAVDLYYGDDVTQFGDPHTYAGLLALYPFFHARQWYWGASFPTPDSMHFEASEELLNTWRQLGLI